MISREEKRIRMAKIAEENRAVAALNAPVRVKRFKKDCPCNKCHYWRSERALRKMQEKMAAAYARMMESTRSIQPHNESENTPFFTVTSKCEGKW